MYGELNEMSMVLDFGRVKKQIKQLIDEHIDHRLLVPVQSDAVTFKSSKQGYSSLDISRDSKSIHLHCPNEAYCLVDTKSITLDSVTNHVYQILRSHLPSNVTGIEVTLRHENINGAFYHYTHGLKKHDGNCQRIAHGHRSPVEILIDGKRDTEKEQTFSRRWQDIYLGSREDLVTISTLSLAEKVENISDESHYAFRYTAPQGEFELAIAKNETEIIPTDTTVELLACYIADEIKATVNEAAAVKIIAYEGVGKGAMAVR
jgi:6-pyruvoyl-tetrahydropterin synthase